MLYREASLAPVSPDMSTVGVWRVLSAWVLSPRDVASSYIAPHTWLNTAESL